MSSRFYRFIVPLHTAADIPSDFLTSAEHCVFESGIFLPQDDKRWFTETPAYPARLLLLHDSQLSIIPHPSAEESSVSLSLDEVFELETGTSLLLGWIRFTGKLGTYHLTYNTRASQPLDQFMAALRQRWLSCRSGAVPMKPYEPKLLGQEPDIKFTNMSRGALEQGEAILAQFFVRPVKHRLNNLLFRKVEWSAGHLIAITSGNRLLWLKDECRGHWERYSGISVSVPLSLLRRAELQKAREGWALLIDFLHDLCWRVPISDSERDCDAFVSILNREAVAKVSISPDHCAFNEATHD